MRITEITLDNSEGVTTIGLVSSGDDGGSSYFLIQISEQYTSQDVELGMDKPYYEYNDQSCSQYGGLKNITFDDRRISFEFKDGSNIPNKIGSSNILFDVEKTLENFNNIKIILQEINGK